MADFELEAQLLIDYGPLDNLKEEIDRRVEGTSSKAEIDADTKKADKALDGVESKSKEVRRETEKPHKVEMETTSATRKLDEMRNAWRDKWEYAIDGLAQRLSNMQTGGGGFGGLLKDMTSGPYGTIVGGAMMAAGGYGLKTGLSEAYGLAYSKKQMEKSTEQVFGTAADSYKAQAEKMADATGFMTTEILQAQIALNKGLIGAKLDQSLVQPLTGRVADMAATSGLPQYANNMQAVSSAVTAGLNGTANALADFGIQLDDVYVLSLPINAAFRALGEELTPAQMAQARYNAIMEQTNDIVGKAADTQDDAGRSMRKVTQAMNEAKASIGEALIPVINAVADFASNIPKPLLQAGFLAGLAVSFAAMLGGAVIGIKALIQTLRELTAAAGMAAAANKTAAASQGLPGAGGLGGLGKAAGPYTTGKLAPVGTSMAALGTYAAIAYTGYELTKAAWNYSSGQMNEQWAKADYRDIRTSLLQKEIMSKKTGQLILPSAEEVSDWKASYKLDSSIIDAMVMEFSNAQKARLGLAPATSGQAVGQNITVTIQDATKGGVQATNLDVVSYGNSLY